MASVTDEKVKDKAGASGKREPKSKRPNPVALEVPVSVAGARPASAHDKRELFTEDTTTVVVFPDGAVIQLSAATTVGQLLFLTDKRTKKEVVCQVVHKRSHRPTTCYVELEFTEDVKNFWGVSFPEHEETEERPATAEAVEAEETTEDDRSEPPAPKTEDVAQLKEEVEELRAQLRELKEKQAKEQPKEESAAAEATDEQTRRLAEAELAARAAAESEAKERAEEIDRKARANATRLAEEARKKLAQSQVQEQAQPQPEAPNLAPVQEEDEGKRRLAEAEAAARAAAEAEAAARAAAEAAAKQDSWAADEEARKASEEARKWEQESIENERKRKQEEKGRRERAERGEAEPAAEASPTRAPGVEPQPEASPVLQVPASTPLPKIGMRLPSAAPLGGAEVQTPKPEAAPAAASTDKEAIDPLEELLPKPALDFSKAPKGLDPNDPYNIYKPMRKKAGWLEIAVAAVLVVVLVGGGGFAWYKNKLPFFHRGPKAEAASKAAPAAKPAAALPNAATATPPANGAAAPGVASGQPANNGTAGASENGTNAAPTAAMAESAPETPAAAKSDASAVPPEEKAPPKKADTNKGNTKKDSSAKAASSKGGKNHGKAETSSESKPKAEEAAVADDAPVLPAKLLHSAQPVYPPDAMLNYITGDVRIEAVVDATGHIGAMQVLVGPAPLRQAAMDALKQYEYAPATQGGKAVASKVTVTIKFWFDP